MFLKLSLVLAVVNAINHSEKLIRLKDSLLLENPSSQANLIEPSSSDNQPIAQYFSQPQDHFDVFNLNRFGQRYFVNDTFFVFGSNAPVFLCVGGEGPAIQPDVVVTGDVHCADMITLASEVGGLILALEHRYYGESIPVPDFTTKNMRFLSSQQALADIANFVSGFYETNKLCPHMNRLIAFGGSYPGMMAGFFRLKFPTLAFASVSASSPVRALVQYPEFMAWVGKSLSVELVGGSERCRESVTSAFAQIGSLLKTSEGQAYLAKEFHVCESNSLDSFEAGKSFTDILSSVFPLQTNDPNCDTKACNYKEICKIQLAAETPVKGMANILEAVFQRSNTNSNCLPVLPENNDSLLNTTLIGGTDRVWQYQTCTQWGFYQTCDPETGCPFTSEPHYNNLQSYFDQCKLAFDITPEMIYKAVRQANLYFGADNPVGSHILYVNGQVDPWSTLSVLSPLPHQPAFVVPGLKVIPKLSDKNIYYLEWTHPVTPEDSKYLVEARLRINNIIKGWLLEDKIDNLLTEL